MNEDLLETTEREGQKSVAVPIGLWARKDGAWIHIRIVAPGQAPTTVTNDPASVRYHRTLFRNLRQTLIEQGAWPFGDEGAETADAESASTQLGSTSPRFQPIQARGGASASEILLRDRGRF
jgi:hypothetical protein